MSPDPSVVSVDPSVMVGWQPAADLLAANADVVQQLQFTTPAADAALIVSQPAFNPSSIASQTGDIFSHGSIFGIVIATQAIEAKAQSLGALAGASVGDVQTVSGGYMGRYAGCDIYYSSQTGAHEVHGDIRAKYNALGGANTGLGLPVTDETGTPDGIGRYNHFQRGSIYWTPNTGPMMVHGAVRDLWASQGWERGPMGYPVLDAHRKAITDPVHNPSPEWSVFENGALYSLAAASAPALVAELNAGGLALLLTNMINSAVKEADSAMGIQGGANLTRVDGWGYGFWASQPRRVTFVISGFHDNGLLPDTTFQMEMTLEFGLTWANSFTEPMDKTLVAYLKYLKIDTNGLGHETLLNGLRDGISNKFKDGLVIRTIPAAALLIGVEVTGAGGLQFLLEPNISSPIEGNLRRYIFQSQLDNLVNQ